MLCILHLCLFVLDNFNKSHILTLQSPRGNPCRIDIHVYFYFQNICYVVYFRIENPQEAFKTRFARSSQLLLNQDN